MNNPDNDLFNNLFTFGDESPKQDVVKAMSGSELKNRLTGQTSNKGTGQGRTGRPKNSTSPLDQFDAKNPRQITVIHGGNLQAGSVIEIHQSDTNGNLHRRFAVVTRNVEVMFLDDEPSRPNSDSNSKPER